MADPEEKKKKGLLDSLIDAVTDRDEKAAAEKAAAEKAAAEKAAAEQAAREQAAARNAAAAKAAAEKAAAEKAAADKAAAEAAAKAAADKAAAERAAAQREAAARAAEERTARQAAAQAAAAAQAPKKGVVQVASLRIRKDHSTQSGLAGGLVRGDEVTILETWTDGKDTWARLGENEWAAMVYDGETYIKLA